MVGIRAQGQRTPGSAQCASNSLHIDVVNHKPGLFAATSTKQVVAKEAAHVPKPVLDEQQDTSRRSVPDRGLSRRTTLLSVAPVLFTGDVLSSLRNAATSELGLWKQEFDLYGRQLRSTLQQSLAGQQEEPTPSQLQTSRPRLDPGLAQTLLDVPLQAISDLAGEGVVAWDSARYAEDYAALYARELRYFQRAGLCGHCGAEGGDAGDARWFDFRAYVQWKAIAAQLKAGPGDNTGVSGMEMMHASMPGMLAMSSGTSTTAAAQPLPSPIACVKARMGELLVQHVVSELRGDELARLLTAPSADLDWVRQGVRVILSHFEAAGYMSFSGIAFFGASRSEPRNHQVWLVGEPAFAKVWMRSPAGLTGSRALRAEEGFSQDYLAAALAAHLRACGVAAFNFRKFPSFLDEELEADQWTMQRMDLDTLPVLSAEQKSLLQRLPPFSLDSCPSQDDPTNCY